MTNPDAHDLALKHLAAIDTGKTLSISWNEPDSVCFGSVCKKGVTYTVTYSVFSHDCMIPIQDRQMTLRSEEIVQFLGNANFSE